MAVRILIRKGAAPVITKPLALLSTTVAALLLAAAAAAVMAQTGAGEKLFPPNPWAYKSDAERQAEVDAAHQRNNDYLASFIASGQDPRSLPVAEIEAYARPLQDLPSSIAEADVIARGLVEQTTFQPNPSGGLPIALSSVRVTSIMKGKPGADTIVVRQLGGPVAGSKGGVFARLDNDESILPGDDVILFLLPTSDGAYTAQPSTGVYFVRDGRAYPERLNPFRGQLSGLAVDEASTMITSMIDGRAASD
jgi:hypothetical protein